MHTLTHPYTRAHIYTHTPMHVRTHMHIHTSQERPRGSLKPLRGGGKEAGCRISFLSEQAVSSAQSGGGVVGIIIPRTCDYVTLCGKKDFVDMIIKFRIW